MSRLKLFLGFGLLIYGALLFFFLFARQGEDQCGSSTTTSVCMPWVIGLWPPRKTTQGVTPTLKAVRDYANAIKWVERDSMIHESKQVQKQTQSQRQEDVNKPLRLLHVINPFTSDIKSMASQRMAMASIESARAWIQYMDPLHVSVRVVAVVSDDEQSLLLPATFSRVARLHRSAMDVVRGNFTSRRRLPLLQDLLRAGLDEAKGHSADFVILSNIDINVMPHFYAIVREMLLCHKTFFINRVEIPETEVTNIAQFHRGPEMSRPIPSKFIDLRSIDVAFEYTMAFSQLHPGYDCFVVASELLGKVANLVGNVFVGYPPAGSILAEAARSVDRLCVTARRIPGTFHVGSRNGEWQGGDAAQYIEFNGHLAQLARKQQKASKCRSVTFKTKGYGVSKCYPRQFYPLPKEAGSAMFPEDYALQLRRKNSSTASPKLKVIARKEVVLAAKLRERRVSRRHTKLPVAGAKVQDRTV